jgi:hypothetical protein
VSVVIVEGLGGVEDGAEDDLKGFLSERRDLIVDERKVAKTMTLDSMTIHNSLDFCARDTNHRSIHRQCTI